MALTVSHGVSSTSTANGTSYTTDAFTPAADDLLVVIVGARTTVAAGGCSSSAGTTFTKVASRVHAGSAHTLYMFVGDAGASATSQTITFTCTGDAATAASIHVARVAGATAYGLSAVRQSAGEDNQAAGGTPAPVFASACLTGNATIGAVHNASNPAGVTEPSGWTERADTGNAENLGTEYATRDSGFTGTTVTWGSTSATQFSSLIVELAAAATVTGTAAGAATGSGTATGLRTILATGAGAGTGTGSATGLRTVYATGAGTGTGTGSASGLRTIYGTAAGAGTASGVAIAVRMVLATEAGTATSVGVAVGAPVAAVADDPTHYDRYREHTTLEYREPTTARYRERVYALTYRENTTERYREHTTARHQER